MIAVVATQMYAIGVKLDRQIKVVIDDETDLGRPAKICEQRHLPPPQSRIGGLVSVLEQAATAFDSGSDIVQQRTGIVPVRRYRIETTQELRQCRTQDQKPSLPEREKTETGILLEPSNRTEKTTAESAQGAKT